MPLRKDGRIIKLSPNIVKEYGFKDGRVYISKAIPGSNPKRKFFFERLVNGNTQLYALHSINGEVFYIQKEGSTFQMIPKTPLFGENQYLDDLKEVTSDCPNVKKTLPHIKYNRRNMHAFIQQYNTCEDRYIPLFTWGAFLAVEVSKYRPKADEQELLNIEFEYHKTFNIGLVADIPTRMDNLFFSSGIIHGKSSYFANAYLEGSRYSLKIKKNTIRIPLIFKFTTHSLNYRHYLLVGGNYKYHSSSESILTFSSEVNNRKQNFVVLDKILKKQLGEAVVGVGIAKQLSVKKSTFFEVRFMQELTFAQSNRLTMKSFSFVTGVNF